MDLLTKKGLGKGTTSYLMMNSLQKEKLQRMIKKSKDPNAIEEMKNPLTWIFHILSAACSSLAASTSASPSPAFCSRSQPSCCSTRPPARWTLLSDSSRRHSTASSPARAAPPPPSSLCTNSPPCGMRTPSPSLMKARFWSRDHTPTYSNTTQTDTTLECCSCIESPPG